MRRDKYTYKLGKGFACDVDVDHWLDEGEFKASVHIGEEYYESDPYKADDLALCEIKGWLEGVKVKLESAIKLIDDTLTD